SRVGAAGVEDRWLRSDGQLSNRHGIGMRWRARYVDDHGREHTKAFTRKADAQRWLDNDVTAKFATGTYVAPEAGRVTVAAVYESWIASQGHIKPRTEMIRRGAWTNRVNPVFGDVPVADVKTSAVKA